MGYEFKCDELNTLADVSNQVIDNWKNALSGIRVNLIQMVQTDAMSGETADSIREYLLEVHIENIIPFLMNMLEDYKTKLAVYNYRYTQIDGDYQTTSKKIALLMSCRI